MPQAREGCRNPRIKSHIPITPPNPSTSDAEDLVTDELDVAGSASSDIRDVCLRAEDPKEFILVVLNVALHEVHARPQQPLECFYV